VGSDVDVEPGEINAWAVVDGDGAEERGEVLDAVGGDGEENYVANNPEDIGEE